MRKTFWSVLLILAIVLSMTAPSLAAEEIAPAASGEPTEPAVPEDAEAALPDDPASGGETEAEEMPAPEAPSEESGEAISEEPPGAAAAPGPLLAEETVEPEALPAADGALPSVLDGASYQDKEKAIVKSIITDGMTDYQKLVAITKYAADNYSYSRDWTVSGFVNNGAGSCDASTQFIIDLCELVGIRAWLRKAGMDTGAGSTHVCALALIDGVYYMADAGYTGTKPRSFDVFEIPDGLSVKDGVLYQYDGIGVEHLVIPAASAKAYCQRRNRTYTVGSMPITQIGYDGAECFDYSGSGAALKSITIPKSVKTVTGTAFKGCKNLENIFVDPDNPYFTSIDGVLYSKDLTRLVCVPAKKTSVSMPGTVTKQDKDAFYGGKVPVTKVSGTPFKDVSGKWFSDSVSFVYNRSLFKGTSATEFSPNAAMTRGMFITVLGRFAKNGQAAALEGWSGTLGVTTAAGVLIRGRTTTESSVAARISNTGEYVTVISKVAKGEDGAVWYKVKYGGSTGYIREKNTGSGGKTLLKIYTGGFTDLPSGAYYTGYGQWAYIDGIMNGVTATTFCPDRNIKRQDICVLMYRYLTGELGKKLDGSGKAFADDEAISAYARTAVYAMRSIGVVSGYPDNTFGPGANATRAEVATMFQNLYKYLNS